MEKGCQQVWSFFQSDENVLKLNSGDSCTTLDVINTKLCTLNEWILQYANCISEFL